MGIRDQRPAPQATGTRDSVSTAHSRVERTFTVPVSIKHAFELLSNPLNLDSITPRWFNLEILTSPVPALSVGTAIDYRLRWRRLPFRWQSVITQFDPPTLLTYEQSRGPYRLFRHEHRFRSVPGGTEIIDRVDFSPPASTLLAAPVAREILRILDHRAIVSARLLADVGSESRCQAHPPE